MCTFFYYFDFIFSCQDGVLVVLGIPCVHGVSGDEGAEFFLDSK